MNLKEALAYIDALKKADKKEFTQHHYNRLKSIFIQLDQSELISPTEKLSIYEFIIDRITQRS